MAGLSLFPLSFFTGGNLRVVVNKALTVMDEIAHPPPGNMYTQGALANMNGTVRHDGP